MCERHSRKGCLTTSRLQSNVIHVPVLILLSGVGLPAQAPGQAAESGREPGAKHVQHDAPPHDAPT